MVFLQPAEKSFPKIQDWS